MSTAIILAGGRSSRSGRIHKGLRQISCDGKQLSWLEYQIRQLRNAGYLRIVVATGYRSRDLLAKAGSALQKHNPKPSAGPFSTLQQSTKGFSSGHTLLVPLDNPVPVAGILHRIRMALRGRDVAKPSFEGRGGHPLMLSPRFIKTLQQVDLNAENARLDKQLRQMNHNAIARVEVNSSLIHYNLNTTTQWRKFKRRM